MFGDIIGSIRAIAKQNARVGVFGIPISGLPYAKEVARHTGKSMTIVPVVKIRLALLPFIGLGALSTDGVLLNSSAINELRIRETDVSAAIVDARQRLEALLPSVDKADRDSLRNIDVAIIVDDAIATGFTIASAAEWVMKRYSAQIMIYVCDVIDETTADTYQKEGTRVLYNKRCSPHEMQRRRTSGKRIVM